MADLLPCPFCGCRPEVHQDALAYKPGFVQIRCSDIGCPLGEVRDANAYETEPEASEAWNRRQPYLPQEDVETLRAALSATEYVGGFLDDRADPDALKFMRECCDATVKLRAIIARLEAK